MKFAFVDLFAGTGGIRLPFDELGGTCVMSSEWDKFAQQTYEANFGEKPFGDICKIDEKKVPKCNLILGGFPCQPFSNAGLKKGFEDTRGTMFFEIARIIKEKKPEILFLENVKGFKNHDKGNTFKTIAGVLDELGYNLSAQVLNAKDFGVPQNRERFYMISLRRDKFGKDTFFKFPEPPKTKTRLGDILEKDVPEKYTISDKLWAGHQRRKKEHQAKGNGFGYCLFNEDSEYTSTISARYHKDGSEILIEQKGKNPRKLTPREAARLQGYPEDFKIVVSDCQAYHQFGNAVAVPVIRALANALKPYLEQIEYEGKIEVASPNMEGRLV